MIDEFEEHERKLRKDCFKVKIETSRHHPDELLLSVTHNGYQWSTINFNNDEMISIVDAILNAGDHATIKDYEDVLKDKKRLAREIDVALHGEKNAAPQASLCDLIPLAAQMREQNKSLRAALEHSNEWVKASLNCKDWEWSGDQRGAAESSVKQSENILGR